MTEWETLSLEDANVRLLDCVHKTPPAVERGYPYIAIPQMKSGRIEFSTARQISEEHFDEWTRKAKPQPFDVVLSRRCNPGETAFVPPDVDFALGQNLVLLRADGTRVRRPFLRWLVRSKYWWDQVERFLNVGAVFDSLRCADIPKFRLPIPPLEAQDTIASLLGALDDKIELNQRMNETLTTMVHAIFKDWFVDFGPVRTKAEDKPPYLDPGLWSLFPDSLDDNDKPEGWGTWCINDIVEHSTQSLKPADFPDELFAHHSIPAYDSGMMPSLDFGESIKSNKYIVPKESILLSKLNPEIPRVWLPIATEQRAVSSTELLVFLPRKEKLLSFVYCLFTNTSFRSILEGMVTGTSKSHQRISPPALRVLEIIKPAEMVLRAFSEIVAPLLVRIKANRLEIQTLARTRDLLLPKLMSGEIRLREAEKLVEEVA